MYTVHCVQFSSFEVNQCRYGVIYILYVRHVIQSTLPPPHTWGKRLKSDLLRLSACYPYVETASLLPLGQFSPVRSAGDKQFLTKNNLTCM